MKLAFFKSINLRLLIAMLAAGLMFTTIGCGDDEEEDESGGSDASVAAGSGGKGGGGGTAGKAGKSGGGGAGGTLAGPKDAAECEAVVKKATGRDTVDAQSKCMCEKCRDSYGVCAMNKPCFDVVICGAINQCSGTNSATCYPEKCGAELAKSPDLSVLMTTGECATKNCPVDTADSGT